MFKAIHYCYLDVFENFRNMCLKTYKLDPANFLSAPWLGWQAACENIKVKRDLLSDIDTLLMVQKGIRGRKCHFIYGMQKLVTNESKIMIKDKESSYL